MCYICWEGALEHDIMLKNWGKVWLGWLPNGFKKGSQHANTTQNTTTQHNTQQPARAATTQRDFPSLSMGRAALTVNHGAATTNDMHRPRAIVLVFTVVGLIIWGSKKRGIEK
jgi:hypothetical protein